MDFLEGTAARTVENDVLRWGGGNERMKRQQRKEKIGITVQEKLSLGSESALATESIHDEDSVSSLAICFIWTSHQHRLLSPEIFSRHKDSTLSGCSRMKKSSRRFSDGNCVVLVNSMVD
mmetsp:Transcript_8167/g.17622  ORF Transcript_8167/g.17622 Transcript_8167/m.17622 type:complete len:120 (-) Transcript_8167:3239-3598(-)